MEKTKSQKMLKVLCVIGIILNAIACILTLSAGAISVVGLNTPGIDLSGAVNGTINGQALTTGQALSVLGIVSVVAGVIYALNVIACILGLRGANHPSKIKPFFYIVIVLIVLQAIAVVANVVSGDISANRFVSILFNLTLLYLANNIKQQA